MPRTDKNTRMLSLYYQLLTGKQISKQAFCLEHSITERTFDRDIEDVRLFLSDEQSYCELQYDRQRKAYYLTNVMGKSLSGEISFLMVDLLFSLKILLKDEMEGILLRLLEVTEIHKNNELYAYILQKADLQNAWGTKSVLKMHQDLARAIKEQKLIEIDYEVSDETYAWRKVKPVYLKVENGFIYLIAYLIDKQYINPAFFRLDRIRCFTVLQEHFSDDVQDSYLDKMKQRDLYSMMAGEEVEVTVRVSRQMKRVLRDVFPLCDFVRKEVEDCYIYKVKTYKQGFLNWILGQEKAVLVIEPENIKNEVILRLKETLRKYDNESDN